MFEFSSNVRNGAKKRIADVNSKQFESSEFNISCKEITLGKAILTHGANSVIYEGEYRGSTVAVKVVRADEAEPKYMISVLVDLTAMATFPHENVAAFYGAGHMVNPSTGHQEVLIVAYTGLVGTILTLAVLVCCRSCS